MVSVIRFVVGPNNGSNRRAEVKEKPVVGRRVTRGQSSQQRTAAASGKKKSTADDDAGDVVEKKPVAAHVTRSVTAKAKKPEVAHITRSVTATAKSKKNVGANKKSDPHGQEKKSGPGKSIPTESNSDIGHIVGQSSTAGPGGSKLMGSVKRRVARKSHKRGIQVKRPGCDLPLCGAMAKMLGSSTCRPSAKSAGGSPQSLALDAAAVAEASAAAAPACLESSASSAANLSPSLANVLKILRTDSDETNTSNLFEEDGQDGVGTKSEVATKRTNVSANQPSQVITEASSSVAFVTPSPYVNPSEEDIFVQGGHSSPESESDDPSKLTSSSQKKSASDCDAQDLSKAPAKSTKKSPAEQELDVATGRVMAAQKVGWLLPPVGMAAAAANPQSEDSPSSETGTATGSMSVARRMSVPPADSALLPPNFSSSSRNDGSEKDKSKYTILRNTAADMKAGNGAPPANGTYHQVKEKQAKLDRAKRIAKKRVEEEHRQKAATCPANAKAAFNPSPPAAATASPISANTDVPVILKDCILQRPDGSWFAYVLRADQTHGLGPFVKKEIASVALGSFQFYIQIESSSTHGLLTAEMLDRARKLTMHVMSLADNINAGRINWSEWHRLMDWNEKYRQLCIRKSKKDDAAAMGDNDDVGDNDDAMRALLQWAECQRKLFRNENPSLTTQMKTLLNDINFDWAGGQDNIEDTQAAEEVSAEEGNISPKKSSDTSPKGIEAEAAALSRAPPPPSERPSVPQPPSPSKQGSKNSAKTPPEEVWRCPNCKHENRKVLKGCGSCHKLRPGYERPKRKVQVPVKFRWSLRKPQSPNKGDGPIANSRTKPYDNRTRMSLRSRPAKKTFSSGNARAKAPASAKEERRQERGERGVQYRERGKQPLQQPSWRQYPALQMAKDRWLASQQAPPATGAVGTSNKPATNGSRRPRGRPPKPLFSIDGCLEKKAGGRCRGMCLAHYRESTNDAAENVADSVANQEKRPTAGDGEADANAGKDVFEFVAEDSDAGAEKKLPHNALDAPAMARRSRSPRTRKRASDCDIETDRNAPSKRPRRYLDSSGNLVERKRRAGKKPQSDSEDDGEDRKRRAGKKLRSDSEEDEEDIDGVKRQRSIAQVKAKMYRLQAKGYRAEMETQEDIHKQKQREDRRRLEKTKEESSEKDDELDGKDRLLEIIKSLLPNEEDVRADKRGNIRSIRELLDDADVRDS